MIVTPEQKARVAKYAAENGTINAIPLHRFAKDIPDLKESTARGWKTVYLYKHRNEILPRHVTNNFLHLVHGYGVPVGRLSSAS